MNRQFWIGVVVVFVAYAALGWLFHGYVLRPIYRSEPLQHLWRSPEAYLRLMPLFHLSNLVFAFFFMWVFVKGSEARGPLEGIRYGLYIWGVDGPARVPGRVCHPSRHCRPAPKLPVDESGGDASLRSAGSSHLQTLGC